MKPTFIFASNYRSARHDRPAGNHRKFPAIEQLFRSPSNEFRARGLPARASHAFRLMTAEMLTKHERDEPIELFFYAFVTVVATWPLLDLLSALARSVGA